MKARTATWALTFALSAAIHTSANPQDDSASRMTGALLIGLIAQADAVDRSGTVILRKLDPSTERFLPASKDTIAKLKLTPAFRFSDILRGQWDGRTTARPTDLTLLRLSPGVWTIEEARTYTSAGGVGMASSSLPRQSTAEFRTIAFTVTANEVTLLPALVVRPIQEMITEGNATVEYRESSLQEMADLAAKRGLAVTAGGWKEVSVDCQLIEVKPFRLKAPVACEPS